MIHAPQTMLDRIRSHAHPHCIYCHPPAAGWQAIAFSEDGAGGVLGTFACPPESEGYPGLVHGGIASGLLDAAMTNALFARGVVALTGRLTVRYHQPLRLARTATVTARAGERRGAWWIVVGEISQDGQVVASAEAWFKDRAAVPGAEP
jgi:acyl-coenzyme A thioesterase PaaI-like protein